MLIVVCMAPALAPNSLAALGRAGANTCTPSVPLNVNIASSHSEQLELEVRHTVLPDHPLVLRAFVFGRMLRRASTGFADGSWSVPGGCLDDGERLPAAAAQVR